MTTYKFGEILLVPFTDQASQKKRPTVIVSSDDYNQVDRPMNYFDRVLYSMQYFHGNLTSARLMVRSLALLWNFRPYCRKTRVYKQGQLSPFESLNDFRYHEHWLRNLLIAASLNGRSFFLLDTNFCGTRNISICLVG